MGPKTKELLSILDQIIQLLQEDGETHWVNRISEYRDRISDSDYFGVEDLLSDYGGMGSFTDLVLGQVFENGNHTWKANSNQSNKNLRELQSRAFKLATDIKKNHQLS